MKYAITVLLLSAGIGCGTPAPYSAHVIETGPDTSIDTVWVAKRGDLYRCVPDKADKEGAPICREATFKDRHGNTGKKKR